MENAPKETLEEFIERQHHTGTGWEYLAKWLYEEREENDALKVAIKQKDSLASSLERIAASLERMAAALDRAYPTIVMNAMGDEEYFQATGRKRNNV